MQKDILGYRIRFNFEFKKLVEVEGINSNITTKEDCHILLWDFDSIDLHTLMSNLSKIQDFWNLPNIYIVESSPNNYHAYCFKVCDLPTALHIISSTPNIDFWHFKLAVMRGWWTLRITPKNTDNKLKLVCVLKSDVKEDLESINLLNVIKYVTEVN